MIKVTHWLIRGKSQLAYICSGIELTADSV